jgi:hypothetical protein
MKYYEDPELLSNKIDDFEIEDWLANNMDWYDVAPYAVQINDADEPDYNIMFTKATFKISKEI